MSDEEYSALEFGKVLANLEAQNRVLAKMQADIEKLFSLYQQLQQQEQRRCKESKPHRDKPDWIELLVGSILGAVAYFVLNHFIEGK